MSWPWSRHSRYHWCCHDCYGAESGNGIAQSFIYIITAVPIVQFSFTPVGTTGMPLSVGITGGLAVSGGFEPIQIPSGLIASSQTSSGWSYCINGALCDEEDSSLNTWRFFSLSLSFCDDDHCCYHYHHDIETITTIISWFESRLLAVQEVLLLEREYSCF